ncbi:GD16287 [Drosophila simulans]|uniref:GD16287 n=1 Tax=Drosophila simulans TaxID=7240 RepID=B4R4J4_DROSI|nr:GD16287 [Drosophila simulans]
MRAKRGAGQKVMMSGSRHNRPAESSRVPPLAREYISAIATDRELDRFMALSSTASSGASGSTHSCALGSVQPPGCASMENESRPESGHRRRTKCSDHPSRERSVSPPPSKHTISQFPSPKSQVTQAKPDEYTIIPIVLASSPSFRSVAVTQTMSQSAEDIRTPTKSPQMQNKKTQTPESVLKSHKRLEWDPAADVGYCKRAMSMSNISTLERSVLEDCGWRQPTEQRPETDLDGVQPHEAEDRRKDDLRISSRVQDPQISSRRPSVSSSQRESLSSYRRDDSRLNSPNSSRLGSQVSSRVESSRASSRRESQTTSLYGSSSATSFDYHMHMQQEVEVVKQNQRRQQEKEVEPQEQLEKEQHQNDMQQEEENGKELRDKDHHSETKQQGNQPLTRDQRKAEQRQEKDHQPEREQQRIQKLTRDQRKAEQRQEKDHQPEREQPGVQQLTRDQRKAIQREKEREQERQYTAAQFEKIRSNRRHANKENQQPENPVVNPSTASTSATSLDIGSGSRPRGELDLGIDLLCSLVRSRSLSQGQKKKLVRDIARRISCLELTESSTSLRSLSISSKEQLKVPTGSLQQAAPTSTNHSSSRSSSKAERIALPVPAPRKRTVIGTSSPLPESLSYSGSTSGSGEVITQKTNVPTRAASTDADIEPLNLQDWLNPMTLSEIEFEERLKGGTDSERRRQLHWVKTEIHRMQGFKNLLESISLPSKSHKEPNTESEPSVDQFQSAATAAQIPSSMRCMGDQKERPDKEYHLQQGMAAEAVKEMENSGTATTPAPPVRIESVGVNLTNSDPSTLPAPPPTQPPPLPPHLYQQNLQNRKKMATPLLASSRSTSGGARSESVCSFVQQRQRQFREHYQNQQQQQFVLLQQQKLYQLQKQLNQQRDILTQRQQHCGQCAQCGHQRTCVHQQHCPKFQRHPQEAQDQHDEREQYMQMQYAQAAGSAYATPLQSGCVIPAIKQH